MAKKKDNTLLYAGIAAAALLLFKKKDSGMAGVGAAKKSTILIDGDFLMAKEVASLLSNSNYIDKYEESHAKDGITKQVAYIYPSFKKAEENLLYVLDYLQNNTNYSINFIDLKNPYVKDFWIRSIDGKRVHILAMKSAFSRVYDGYNRRKTPDVW